MSDRSFRLSGLRGDPNLTLTTDPRIDPRLVEVMTSTWGYCELDELAARGMVVVGVEFRNSAGSSATTSSRRV